MEIKYTTDGRKVAVVGKLNSQETIVQEIFISGGNEIPSGENFVVKSLHDAPSVSWKEQRLKELEERFDRDSKKLESGITALAKEYEKQSKTIKYKIGFLEELEDKMEEGDFDRLIRFISGDIKWLVTSNYGELSIVPFDDKIAQMDDGRFEGLKLLTIFGNSSGSLSYRINDYRDGSGSYETCFPCKTEEEAMSLLKGLFYQRLEKGLTDSLLKSAKKYNLEIPDEAMRLYKDERANRIKINIERQKELLKQYEDSLIEFI